jgi:hypothetical protein
MGKNRFFKLKDFIVMRPLIALLCALTLLFGCEKKEMPYPPAQAGIISAEIGSDYSRTSFFNVLTGEFVANRARDEFQFSFSSGVTDTSIFLNSFNYMFAKNTGDTNFAAINDTSGEARWKFDLADGYAYHTAISGFLDDKGRPNGTVYLIDLGYDKDVNKLNYNKLQVFKADDIEYQIKLAELDGSNIQIFKIQRDPAYRRIMLNTTDGSIRYFEPPMGEWDLCFSQYTDLVITQQGDSLNYLVRGTLFDRRKLTVARLDSNNWDDVDLSFALGLQYSTKENEIGFDWKTYSFSTGAYQINQNLIYVLNMGNDGFIKLRFVDFYNDNGERGFPRFEMIGL